MQIEFAQGEREYTEKTVVATTCGVQKDQLHHWCFIPSFLKLKNYERELWLIQWHCRHDNYRQLVRCAHSPSRKDGFSSLLNQYYKSVLMLWVCVCQCQMWLPNIALPRPKPSDQLWGCVVEVCNGAVEQNRHTHRESLAVVRAAATLAATQHETSSVSGQSQQEQQWFSGNHYTAIERVTTADELSSPCSPSLPRFVSLLSVSFLDATSAAINKDTNKLPVCLPSSVFFFSCLLSPHSFALLLLLLLLLLITKWRDDQ